MEPPFKRARIGAGDPENFEENSTESEESEGVQVSGGGADEDKLMLSENTNSHPAPVELEELTRNESCLLGDLKGSPDDLNVGESKKEEVSEIRNSWLTEYAEIALKEKENENKTLKKEYKAFVDEYAKASNQILKVMAKQKKEIADLKLKNGNQKMQIDLFEKGKEVKVETKVEATDEKEGIVKCESLERKPFAVSFRKVGGDAFKDKEVLMLKDKEEIISLFNAELRDIEEGMNYLNDVIKAKESEIDEKDKVLGEETEQRAQLEAQAEEAKGAFKEALETQMDEIERMKKESNTASPKVDVFKKKLEAKKVLINQLTLELESAKAALLAKESESDAKETLEEVLQSKDLELEQMRRNLKNKEEVLESKDLELEQMRRDLKNKLNNVSHKENFFKEALEAKSVVINQQNEDLRRENVELKNRNLRQSEALGKIEDKRRLEKEAEKSQKSFVLKLQSENIEQEDQIALLRHQARSLQKLNEELENWKRIEKKKVSETVEVERERLHKDVIFELEACNKKQDDQIDKLEKKISQLHLKLDREKCEQEELKKQKGVLIERNVSLKKKLITQKKSTEEYFKQTISEMKQNHRDQLNHLKMPMEKANAGEEFDVIENGTEPSQSQVKAFITQIESTDKVSEIDNLFAAMFTSTSAEEEEERRKVQNDLDAAPVAGSSCTNYTTRDLAFFSSEEEEDDNNKSRKSNSRFSHQPQPPKNLPHVVEIPERRQEVAEALEVAEAPEEGDASDKEKVLPSSGRVTWPARRRVFPPPAPLRLEIIGVGEEEEIVELEELVHGGDGGEEVEDVSEDAALLPRAGRCPLCRKNFPTTDKLEVHASRCMKENSFSLKSCFVSLKNIKCGENEGNSRENISPRPKRTIIHIK